MIKTTTTPEAWEVTYKIADAGEYELDKDSQERAGYPIYRAKESYYSRICDLGCRLEVVKADGTSTNIWIEPQEPAEEEEPAHYGDALAEKIRETTTATRPFSPPGEYSAMASCSCSQHCSCSTSSWS